MSKKKKILIVGPDLSLPGGVAHHVNTLLSSPLSHDFELDYFKVGKSLNDGRVKIFIKFILSPIRFLWKMWKFWPDVVHLNPSFDLKSLIRELNIIALCKLYRRSTLVQFHGGDLTTFMRNDHLPIYLRLIFNWASCLVVLTHIQKKPLLKHCAEQKISVIPNMIDTSLFQWKDRSQNSQYRILYMSKIESKKGAVDVMDSIQFVLGRFSNVKFLFAGDGPDKEKLKLFCCKNRFEEHVKFFGYVHDQRKINFLCRGDIFLFPSHYQEGMPYALLEAMAAGLPVIATSTGGIPEIIEHNINGILISPGEPTKLSQAINKLLANHQLREEFGTKNRYKAETEYDIKVVCEKFTRLYRKLSDQN